MQYSKGFYGFCGELIYVYILQVYKYFSHHGQDYYFCSLKNR